MRPAEVLAVAVATATVLALGACGGGGEEPAPTGTRAEAEGRTLYARNCASCHGDDLKGTTTGPPLLSEIYEPGHHPDASFHNAVSKGVQAHHWSFGPMPPVPALGRGEIDAIIAYVRAEQRSAGIG